MKTRDRILLAAKELAGERQSIQGVAISLESVAQRAGLTKQGLMYYFKTKEDLMFGLVEHAAQHWDEMLHEQGGAGPEDLSPFDRHRAYIVVATTGEVSRGDYWIFTEALYHSKLSEPWHRCVSPWFDTTGLSGESQSLLNAARFCADGVWMSLATGLFPAENVSAVSAHTQAMIDRAEQLERGAE